MAEDFGSGHASETETSATIASNFTSTAEVLCPHSAIGVKVANVARDLSVPMITLATAHPAKFPDAVEAATKMRPGLPDRMSDLYDRPERVTRVANDLSSLQELIRERTAQ